MGTARRVLVGPIQHVTKGVGITPTAAMAKLLGVLVVPVAVIATGVGVVATSYSAFSSETSTPATSWSAGTVALTNDSGTGTAAFTTSALKPGSTGERCITVSSTGTLPSVVRLYATSPTGSGALSSALLLTITQGTGGGSAGSCTGFNNPGASYTGTLTAFSALNTYADGVLPWTTTGPQTSSYRIQWVLPATATNDLQGLQAGVVFKWEAQNT